MKRGVILRRFHHAAAREQKLPAQRAARRRRLTLECTEGGFAALGEDLGNGAACLLRDARVDVDGLAAVCTLGLCP